MEEPLLMQYQEGALNCDTFAQSEFLRLKKEFKLKYAIETGTCLGYTTAFLCQHYEVVKTIEVNAKFLNIAKVNRLNQFDNCKMFFGDSSKDLYGMLENIDDSTFIFLDAHWGNHCPLKDELQQIARANIRPVIAIHDFLVPNKPELGYDSINGQPFTFEWLKSDIDAIYQKNGYDYHYNNESTGAKRGIIYITPKHK